MSDSKGEVGPSQPDIETFRCVVTEEFGGQRPDRFLARRFMTERDGEPYGDLPSFMDFDYLARVCQLNVALLCELASAPPPPAGDDDGLSPLGAQPRGYGPLRTRRRGASACADLSRGPA